MHLSNCSVCNSKNSSLLKEQEAIGLLSTLGIKTALRKIPLVGYLLFWGYKMNKVIKRFFLAGNYFILEMHLGQPNFTYNARVPFTESKERIKKF